MLLCLEQTVRKVEEFKKHLSIPIINGLSPSSHQQVLSVYFEEIKKPISKLISLG